MSMRYGILAIMLTVASRVDAAPTIEARLTPPMNAFHLAARYTLVIEGDAALSCEFPELTAAPGQMELRRLPLEQDMLPDGTVRFTQSYELDPIFPGRYVVPASATSWREGDSEGRLSVPAIVFEARELSDEERAALEHFAGITMPESLIQPRRISTSHALFVSLALCAAAALIGLLLWRRRGRDLPALPAAPPWEIALGRLRELKRRALPEAGKIDAYYVDLSTILRYYIEDRFHIHAPEQTTPEFLETAAQERVFSDAQQAFLAGFLLECDRVKFARLMPGLDDMAAHFDQVKRFVQDTMPAAGDGHTLERAA